MSEMEFILYEVAERVAAGLQPLARLLHRMGHGARQHQAHPAGHEPACQPQQRYPERQQDERRAEDHADQTQDAGEEPQH